MPCAVQTLAGVIPSGAGTTTDGSPRPRRVGRWPRSHQRGVHTTTRTALNLKAAGGPSSTAMATTAASTRADSTVLDGLRFHPTRRSRTRRATTKDGGRHSGLRRFRRTPLSSQPDVSPRPTTHSVRCVTSGDSTARKTSSWQLKGTTTSPPSTLSPRLRWSTLCRRRRVTWCESARTPTSRRLCARRRRRSSTSRRPSQQPRFLSERHAT
mmetsp:Transcript_3863/g.12089  ORF Transcript_3863/g.12089 Transcript_3863/m.12089 type:complete len:211 (+) Transcript_3863:946-1578(+)